MKPTCKHAPPNSPRSTIELVVMGGGGVGKSSVTIQYVQVLRRRPSRPRQSPAIGRRAPTYRRDTRPAAAAATCWLDSHPSPHPVPQDFFIPYYDPTIEDSYRKQVEVDAKVSLLQILDTAGQEEFQVMRDGWMRNGDCFLLVFSATSRRSFDELETYRTHLQRVKDTDDPVPVVIMMNKIDLVDERQVGVEEAEELAKRWGCPLIKASAKEKTNITEGFEEAVREHRRHVEKTQPIREEKLRQRRRAILASCSIM